jgi:hypothetical protein
VYFKNDTAFSFLHVFRNWWNTWRF